MIALVKRSLLLHLILRLELYIFNNTNFLMATNQVLDAVHDGDSGRLSSVQEQLTRNTGPYDHANSYPQRENGKAINLTSRNSSYHENLQPRANHQSNYDGHHQPRATHRSNYYGHFHPRDCHRDFIPHFASDAYYRQETYPRWNTYQRTDGNLGFSGPNGYVGRNLMETERQKPRNWTSRNSGDRQLNHRAGHRDFISNPSLPDAYHIQGTYPRRDVSHSTAGHPGFPLHERSNAYYGYGVGSYSSNSYDNGVHVQGRQPYRSHRYDDASPRLSVNDKYSRQFPEKRAVYPKRALETQADHISYKGIHADLVSSRSSSFQQLKEKAIKVEHHVEKAVEETYIGEKGFVEANLAPSEIRREKSGSDIAKTDNLALEKNLAVPQLLIPRGPSVVMKKKLLVLDLNGLLADIVHPPPQECKGDTTLARRAIFRRPYCNEFLKFCFDTFEVGIWSSRTKKIIDKVVDYLLGDMKNRLLFCWDQSHCTGSGFRTLENEHKELLFKELRKIWEGNDSLSTKGEYNESNTLLLDDSPYKALLNPVHTAIFPCSYSFMDPYDNSLGPGGDLLIYLQKIAAADNVQKYVEGHPFGQMPIDESHSSWDFYHKVLSSQSLQKTIGDTQTDAFRS